MLPSLVLLPLEGAFLPHSTPGTAGQNWKLLEQLALIVHVARPREKFILGENDVSFEFLKYPPGAVTLVMLFLIDPGLFFSKQS